MSERVHVGSVVRVPVHGRRVRAFVTDVPDEPAVPDPKPLSALVASEPLFGPSELELARWAARRYVVTLGAVLRRALPGRYSAPAVPGPDVASPAIDHGPPTWLPSDAMAAMVRPGAATTLVAPAGGRLDLVRHAAASASARTLVLVPRVDTAVALADAIEGSVVIHAELRPADRAAAWARSRDGQASAVIGTRAALFAPVRDLALVLLLDAHDDAFKEERAPRIHGVVAARERARIAGCAFVASSPAPPIVPLHGLRTLEPRRAEPAPQVARPRGGPVTSRLLEAIRAATSDGEDALVHVGRKGFALRVRCRDCGWYPRCPDCGAGLALGKPDDVGRLRCRACGREERAPDRCGSCGGGRLDGAGWGTERVARALTAEALGAPVVRLEGEAEAGDDTPQPAVIVSTKRTLHGRRPGAVCVADLDQQLGLPDFAAAEHALGLLWDLAGTMRAGGRFLVQTREPDHRTVQAFTRRSHRFFTERELGEREAAGYPPFAVVVRVDLPADEVPALAALADGVGARAIGPLRRPGGRAAVLLRASELEPLLDPLRAFLQEHPSCRVDVDPVDVL